MGTQLPSPKRGGAPQFSAHVYSGQTARWIKMAFGTEVGLDPGHIVLDGDPPPLPKRGHFGPFLLWPNGWMHQDATWYGSRPQPRQHCARWGPSFPPPQKRGDSLKFSAQVYCGQTAGCIKMPLGTEFGLGPGDIVLDGDPASPPPKKGAQPPNFGPCLLWRNGCMYKNTTWYGGRPQHRRHCVRWGPSSPSPKGAYSQFSANVCCGQTAGWTKDATWYGSRLRPMRLCVRSIPSSLQKKKHSTHPIFGPCLFWPNGWVD